MTMPNTGDDLARAGGARSASSGAGPRWGEDVLVFIVGALVQTSLADIMWVRRIGLAVVARAITGQGLATAPSALTAVLSLVFLALVSLSQIRSRQAENLIVSASLVGLMGVASIAIAVITRFWVSPIPFAATAVLVVAYSEWRRFRLSAPRSSQGETLTARDASAAASTARPAAGAQEQFLDARRFWSDLLTTFQNPVLVLDRAGLIQTFNPAAADFARRFDLDLISHLTIETLFDVFVFGDARVSLDWPLAETWDLKGVTLPAFTRAGIDGEGRTYEVRFTPTRSARGDHTGWIVHMLEVTVRISEVREREIAVHQREEALQFLSHDIRTPQLAILAVLDHTDFKRAPTGLTHRIEQQARRTLALAEGYVRLVQAETDSYSWVVLDLGHVLEDATDSVWELCQATGVSVRLEPWTEEAAVLGDRGLLSRALVNLLDNAIKFSTPGKSVVCRLSRTQLAGRPAVSCEIADKAGGMSREQLTTLFNRYASFRTAASGARGTGLGLALVHAVVKRHEGTVTCESAQGVGSVFRVTLPIHDDIAVPPRAKLNSR